MRTNVLHVKVSDKSGLTLLLNVAIESAHFDLVKNLWKYGVGSKMFRKHSSIHSKAKHCIKV